MKKSNTLLTLMLITFFGLVLAQGVAAKTLVVNTTNDTVPGKCTSFDCTLREAVIASNMNSGPDVIHFSVDGTFVLSRAIGIFDANYGDLNITDDVTIIGNGELNTILDGNLTDRIIETNSGAELYIQNLSMQNGTAEYGAGIYARDDLTMNAVNINNNTADQSGGGVYITGISALSVSNSEISNNKAVDANAGGVYADEDVDTVFESVTLDSNTADNWGGGMAAYGPTALHDTTIINNYADHAAGGLYSKDELLIDNSTIEYNGSDGYYGGGLFIDEDATIMNSSLNYNDGDARGGAIYIRSADVSLVNTKIIGNEATDGGGVYVSTDSNLIMERVEYSDNQASQGGGLYVNIDSYVSANATNFENNFSYINGGGVYIEDSGSSRQVAEMRMTHSSVSGNTADYGGGVYVGGIFEMNDTTINENFAENGGGLYIHDLYSHAAEAYINASSIYDNEASNDGGGLYIDEGIVNMTNSTVSGNSADYSGGGLYLKYSTTGEANIAFSTIANNNADISGVSASYGGGGIYNDRVDVYIKNTIIADNNNSVAPDCRGTIISYDYNIAEDITGCNYIAGIGDTHVDPSLNVLADYGGATWTHELLSGSTAIDVIPASDCTDFSARLILGDQRQATRDPSINYCDIGSFEL